MTKDMLVATMAKKTGVSKKVAAQCLDAFTETVAEQLAQDRKVMMVGFGVFETRTRRGREVTVPNTETKARVPDRKVPAFRPGKTLQDALD